MFEETVNTRKCWCMNFRLFYGYFQRVVWQNFERENKDGIIYGLSHVSKNKNALFIKCTCRIKSVWSIISVKPRWFCDFLYKGISLMVLFSTDNSYRHTDEIISLWSITVWVQTQSYPSCMISLHIRIKMAAAACYPSLTCNNKCTFM